MKFAKSHSKKFIPWIVPISLIVTWQLLVQFDLLPTKILPAPTSIVRAALRLSETGELFYHIAVSTRRAALGFLIGGSLGFSLGLLNGVSKLSEQLFDSTIQMIRNIPNLALLPLVLLWFGIGEESRLFLVALGVLFPIYINTFYGIRNIDPGLIEMGKVYGLDTFSQFWRIIIPGALPSILVGVRFALGLMWVTLIVAETFAVDSGIGYMAMDAREFLRTDVLVLAILMYALLGKLADIAARSLEKVWLQWNPGYQST